MIWFLVAMISAGANWQLLQLKLYNQVRLTTLYDAAKVDALISADSMMDADERWFKLKYHQQ